MKRYTISIIFGVVAAALLVVAVLASTIWRPQQEVVAQGAPGQPFTVTRPGVLELYADQVEVRATSPSGGTVWLAVGDAADIGAWLEGHPYEEIVGLSDLETLKMKSHGGDEAQSGDGEEAESTQSGDDQDSDVNPIESDMWTSINRGKGEVSLKLTGEELDDTLLAATDGVGPAPVMTLKWPTPQDNGLAKWAYIGAGVAAAVAALLAGIAARRRNQREEASPEVLRALPSAAALAPEDEPQHQPKDDEDVGVAELAIQEDSEAAPSPATQQGAVDLLVLDEEGPTTSAATASQPTAAEDDETRPTQRPGLPSRRSLHAHSVTVDAGEQPLDLAVELTEVDAVPLPAEGRSAFAPATGAEFAPDFALDDTQEPDEPKTDTPTGDLESSGDVASIEEPPVTEETVTVEEVDTDSGMMNLAALRSGGAFPTRRAMREASKRGVNKIVVGDREFSTPTAGEQPADVLEKRSTVANKWEDLLSSVQEDGEDKE